MVPWTDEEEALGEIAFNAVLETLAVNNIPATGEQANWKTLKFVNKLAWIQGAGAVELEVRSRIALEAYNEQT